MKEINAKLQEKLSKLEDGKLELSELESLVDDARELYERLLIVKYKAYENYGEPEPEEKEAHLQEEIQETEPEEEAIDFSGITEEPELDEQPSFDFSAIEESIEKVEEVEETASEIETDEIEEDQEEESNESLHDSHEEKDEPEDEDSLNQTLQGNDDDLSLRKKLQSTPISDLKSEISIAKKFEYITFMFEGRNEIYEEAIDSLNNCSDGEEAKDKLNEYSTQYNWDLENKSIIKFVELVERRYL